MPRKRERVKSRRPAPASSDVAWLLDEPTEHSLCSAFSDLADLDRDMERGYAGMSNVSTPITPDDVKSLRPHDPRLRALRRLRRVLGELPPEIQPLVSEDRRALVMAVDEYDPAAHEERIRAEQAAIDARTGRKEGQLLDADGRPYYLKDQCAEGDLRRAARSDSADLRTVFDATPNHIRIRVPEAWARLGLWSAFPVNEADADKEWTLNYSPHATRYTVRRWSAMPEKARRVALQERPERIIFEIPE